MASLFEIDEGLISAIDAYESALIENDGEITEDVEKLREIVNNLAMERSAKIENIALHYKNLEAEEKAVAEQKKIFDAREKALKNKKERMKNLLEYALGGEKFDTARVKVSYRKSESVEVNDDEFINWAKENNRSEFLTYKEPTANKTALKESLKEGEIIPGAVIVEKQNIQIK